MSKKRVGLIVPSGNVVVEPMYGRLAHGRCEFFATRILLTGCDDSAFAAMENEIPRVVAELASANTDLLISCCTASAALKGWERDQHDCRAVETEWGIPMTSTMLSVVAAFQHLAAKRIVLVSPYTDELNNAEKIYLARRGFDVVATAGQGIIDGSAIADVSEQEIVSFALQTWRPGCDALFLSCMNWRSAGVIPLLEARLGVPVVTSHSAAFWHAITSLGLPPDSGDSELGALMTDHRSK